MQRFLTSLALLCAGSMALLANQAQLTMQSTSVRLMPGNFSVFGFNNELSFTSVDPDLDGFAINDELVFTSDTFTHGSLGVWYDELNDQEFFGTFEINIPLGDADKNWFIDFFETSRAINTTTTGRATFPGSPVATITCRWNREAGNPTGTCLLKLVMNGATYNFSHLFEILEYTGTVSYSPPTGTNLTTTISLVQTGHPENSLKGPLPFHILSGTELEFNGSFITNQADSELELLAVDDINLSSKGTYDGVFVYVDYDLSTVTEDYDLWIIGIKDANDSNSNGIPDLSDIAPGTPASLRVQRNSNGTIELSIEGNVGTRYELQGRASLGAGSWETKRTFTLAAPSESILSISEPAASEFFRLVENP